MGDGGASALGHGADHRHAVRLLARWGLASVALSFALVGVLALIAAIGSGSGGATDRQGALARLADSAWGFPLLIAVAAGFAGYAVWRLYLAVTGEHVESDEEKHPLARVGYAARGLLYLGLCAGTISLLTGRGGSGGGDSETRSTATVLEWPAGRLLVAAIGAGFAAAAIYTAYRAVTKRYEKNLKVWEIPDSRQSLVAAVAVFGLLTRTILYGIISWFFVRAAVQHDPDEAIGLDGALRKLAEQPYGRVLLGLVALGLLSYAAFRALESRYRKV